MIDHLIEKENDKIMVILDNRVSTIRLSKLKFHCIYNNLSSSLILLALNNNKYIKYVTIPLLLELIYLF